jgi:hypothetical protein
MYSQTILNPGTSGNLLIDEFAQEFGKPEMEIESDGSSKR